MATKLPVLIVDDSATQLELIKDALEGRGYRVETARNGMEAITRVYQSPPGLILSDVMMPELNGYHLCRLVKNDPYTAHIPVILLTNLRERHDRFWGEKAGADRYLEKTHDLSPILDQIDALALASPPAHLCNLPPQRAGVRAEDIQARVTSILDRLLYESTISNEILKLTGLAHDSDQLVREFLHFLSVICRYSAATLMIGDGRNKQLLGIHLCEPAGPETVADLMHQAQLLARPLLSSQDQIRQLTIAPYPDEREQRQPGEEKLTPLHSLVIRDRDEAIAQLVLFHRGQVQLSEGVRHALDLVADRFRIVASYHHKIKTIEQVKSDFVSMLVHDLRAPLTSIRGFTNVLAQGIYGPVNREQGEALTNVENGCDRLLGLIEDILDLSRLEAGKLQIHPAPLRVAPVAERVIQELRPLFQEKAIEVRLELAPELPYVHADGKQLARVLANLLTNAAKFTPEGGRVVVSAGRTPHCPDRAGDDRLQICVTDSGEGIPAELQRLLFNRFQQLPVGGIFRKGTGLGLAICREIIALHGGEIWVESPVEAGGGSRFSFTLPVSD